MVNKTCSDYLKDDLENELYNYFMYYDDVVFNHKIFTTIDKVILTQVTIRGHKIKYVNFSN